MASMNVQDVSISFPIFHSESRSLKKTVFAAASERMGRDTKRRMVVQALKDISLTLNSGDRLGFVGSNGAGKTTLLRTMAGIYEPFHGQITVNGVVTALLDASQGMNHELTGRENIRLRGLFSGLNETQLKLLEEDVASFSELEEFLELPVRTYSSGMVVRLGFALATSIKPQILLMDEWIMAGDASFVEKARSRVETMVRGAEILVLSSHSPEIIMKWCNRVIWMDGGKIKAEGSPEEVLAAYLPPEQLKEAKAVALIKA
jgi:lipopolysaccharide transport system ATP-binding protein